MKYPQLGQVDHIQCMNPAIIAHLQAFEQSTILLVTLESLRRYSRAGQTGPPLRMALPVQAVSLSKATILSSMLSPGLFAFAYMLATLL
jgi:hypothetical protein